MKHFSYAVLRHNRQFRALTGVEPSVFSKMVERLRPHWRERIVASKDRSGRPWRVGGLEDHLLVLLILYRCAITQDFVACLYGTDQSVVSRALRRIEKLAARVLGVKHAIRVTAEEAEALIFDCTEQPIQRPSRKQHRWYSGKKKRHTIKIEIAVTGQGRIAAVSKSAPGSVHDITLRRRGPPIPKNVRAYADSGYQSLQHDHRDTELPYKKSKKHPLTKDERDYNHALSRFRVRGEHALAKLKSFRILSERYRYPKIAYAPKFSLIAGIVNLAAGF
jgi:IS5 family transposase